MKKIHPRQGEKLKPPEFWCFFVDGDTNRPVVEYDPGEFFWTNAAGAGHRVAIVRLAEVTEKPSDPSAEQK